MINAEVAESLMNAMLVGIMHNLQKKIHEQINEIYKRKHFLLTKNIFFDYNKNVKLLKTEGR